jgi:hypothetical protein
MIPALLLSFIVGFILGRLVAKPGLPLGPIVVVSACCGFALGLLF